MENTGLAEKRWVRIHQESFDYLLPVKLGIVSDLEFFVLVARLGNLSAAARMLNLSPPAGTKRLAQMESRLSVRLVNRTTRGASLTSEGEIYLLHAKRILAEVRAMEDAVSSSRTAPRGLLRINATLGFGRTISGRLLPTKRRCEVNGFAVLTAQ